MAEITTAGVTGKSLAEYLTAMRARYLDIDDAWNINPESPDGLAIAAWCEALANLDEQVVFAYQSVDPNSAVGQQLDRIAAFAGVLRQGATYSTATVSFAGVNGTVIPAGTRVRNRATDTLWATNGAAAIAGGVASVGVTCVTAGAQTASPGDLSIIATPVGGLQSVTNAAAASLGLDEEKDEAFRARRNDSVSLPGSNQIDNIYAVVGNVDGVKQVRVFESSEDGPDADGVAGHSMAIFVDGGSDADVLKAIASRKNPGTGLNRDSAFPNKVTGDTTTPLGQPVNITFFRPELVTVYARVEIASSTLSEQDKARIKSEMVAYSLLGFQSQSGFNREGYRIGENVAAGRLYTPVNFIVAGNGYVQSIKLGFASGAINSQVLDLAFNQLGVLDAANITVEYV
ncbi:MAG: baseplate J/gp47 family protein [Pigmentiphaga sp.]